MVFNGDESGNRFVGFSIALDAKRLPPGEPLQVGQQLQAIQVAIATTRRRGAVSQ